MYKQEVNPARPYSNESFRKTHREFVEDELYQGANSRQPEWTESVAVGNKGFIEPISKQFGALAKGRKLIKGPDKWQLRDPPASYNAVLTPKKEDIEPQNLYFLGFKTCINRRLIRPDPILK